jgi:hypothetical protein
VKPEEIRQLRHRVKGLDRRDAVEALMGVQGLSQAAMARILDCHRTTVAKEVRAVLADRETYVETDPEREFTRDDLEGYTAYTPEAFEAFFLRFSEYDTFPDHFREWTRAFFAHDNVQLAVAPRHGKSTWAKWLAIWHLCRDRGVRIIYASKTSRFALSCAAYVAAKLTDEALVRAFGEFKPAVKGDKVWSPGTGRLEVQGSSGFSFLSVGRLQQVLGWEAHVLIVDDITDGKVERSETDSVELRRWLREDLFSRFSHTDAYGPGHLVMIGQRVSHLDTYAYLSEEVFTTGPRKGEPLFHLEAYPAIKSWERQEVLWPEGMPFSHLLAEYERMGRAGFETMFQGRPVPPGGSIIEEAWLVQCRDHERSDFEPKRYDPEAQVARVLSIDPSPTMYTGIVLADAVYAKVPEDWRLDVLHSERRKFRSTEAVLAYLKQMTYEHGCQYVICEDSSVSKHLLDADYFRDLKSNGVQLLRHKTTITKQDLEVGVRSLGPLWEFSRISLPYGNADAIAGSKALEEEVQHYPSARLSDILMALWFIKYNWRRLIPTGVLPTTFDVEKLLATDYKGNGYVQRMMLDRLEAEVPPDLLEQFGVTERPGPWALYHLAERKKRRLLAARREAIRQEQLAEAQTGA